MALADRVKDTSSSTGAGNFVLSGAAPSGFQPLSAIGPVGATFGYVIDGGAEWEVGTGTITAANTFSRAPTASSNAGAAVNFSAGTKGFFCTLTAAELVKIDRSTSTRVYHLSKVGAVDDADVSQTSSTFGTDSTAAIQAVLDLASSSAPIKVVVDGRFSVTGLRVKGHTHIDVLPGCGVILRTGSHKTLLENYNFSFDPATRTDKNIKVTGGIWNGNCGASNTNNLKGNGTTGLNCGMRFYGVENLIVEPDWVVNSPSYAVHALNCKNYKARGASIDRGYGTIINNDGIHADGNCSDVVFRDLVVNANDDGIAFNADDLYRDPANFTYPFYPAISNGPINNVLVDNVRFNNSALYGVRILSGASRIDAITLRNIKGSTKGYAVIIDNYWQNPSVLSYAGAGNVGTIVIEDLDVTITATGGANDCTINVNCSVDKLIIRNLRRNDFALAIPTILISGAATVVKSLVIDGYQSFDSASSQVIPHIKVNAATVQELVISGANVKRVGAANASSLVSVTGSGTIGTLRLIGIDADGINKVLDNSSGTISRVLASGVVHLNAAVGQATLQTASAIARLNLSAYIGTASTSGTFTTVTGDGIIADLIAPTASSAAVLNATPTFVDIVMSEAMDTAFTPAASSVTVSGHTVSTLAWASSTVLRATVSAAFVNGEAARTAAYTQPGTNNARDSAGNLLANFSGLAITNGVGLVAEALTFAAVTGDGTVSSTGGVWKTSSTNAAYGHIRMDGKKLAAGTNGIIYQRHTSDNGSIYAWFGMQVALTPPAMGPTGGGLDVGFVMYPAADATPPAACNSGTAITMGSGANLVIGNYYGLRRTGSVWTFETSTDAISWTVLYTYSYAGLADMYPYMNIYGASVAGVDTPMHIGLV